MPALRLRRWSAALACTVLAFTASGCSSGTDGTDRGGLACPLSAAAPLTVVIGARANSAVPTLPPALEPLLLDVVRAEQQITLIRLDGQPDPFFREKLTYTSTNPTAREDEVAVFLGRIREQFAGPSHAKVPEADVLSAISDASRTTAPGGTIMVLDSGLQTVPPLDFRENDLLLSEPNDVVGYLRTQRLLPDLVSRNLVFVGLGDTAWPQEALNDRLRSGLVDIWRGVGQAAGACVDVVPVGGAEESVPGVPPVTPVSLPVPPPPPAPCGDTVLSDQNNVGFRENTTEFRDEVAARAEIARVADQARNGRQRIRLIGTTARHGSRDSQLDLSRRRAEKVRDVLVALGISADRIETSGVGSDSSEFYVFDGGPDNLDPVRAVQNRRVVARLVCS